MTAIRHLVTVAASVAAVLLVAGCSGDGPPPPPPKIDAASSTPTPGDGSTPSASGTPSRSTGTAAPTARPPVYGERAPDRVSVTVGTMPSGGQKLVVARALVAYVDARLAAFHTATIDLEAVAAVASGPALQQIESYVAGLKQRGEHTVGTAQVNVDRVTLSGKKAQIGSCIRNTTADANRSNQIVEREVSPAYLVRATAMRVAPQRWLISKIDFVFVGSCS